MGASDKIEKLLNYLKINAKVLSERLEYERPQVIYDIQNGKTKRISEKLACKIISVFPEISKAWLLADEGDMLKEADSTAARPDDEPPSEQSVTALPLIPVNALAGALSGSDLSVMEYECERYIVPILKGAEFLIRVQGDSMIPKYSSGDIVACQRVPLDGLWFQWGKTYVIDTRQGALIKRIEPSEKEGCISIHSENPRYKPFDLPKEEINGVALVRGIIRVE